MKRKYAMVAAAAMLMSTVCMQVSAEGTLLEETVSYEQQSYVDEALIAEAQAGFTFEEPEVILNPYGNTPLSAVVIFTTEEEMGGSICVKGKEEENNIEGTFPAATEHIVPVYGLYSGDTTEVELTLEDGTSSVVEITTEAIPFELENVEVNMIDASVYDYSKLTMVNAVSGTMYALDAAGDIRWYYGQGGPMGTHILENGRILVPNNYLVKPSYYRESMLEMDLLGKVYMEYAIPGGVHHDFQELSNGNLIVASGASDLSSVEDHVYEIDRTTGEVVWDLAVSDLLGINDGTSVSALLTGYKEEDWFHNNAVWYDEENDQILLSGRNKDAIIAVNKSDKTLAWILGNPEGWEEAGEEYFFTPQGDDFEWQYAQHEVTLLDNGDVMLFDNGSNKVKANRIDEHVTGDDIYSRAVIYHINTEDMTISQVFEYGKERGPEWYSDFMSGVESLDGTQDTLWITSGTNLYNPETDSYDSKPMDQFLPQVVKTSYFDQVTNGELTCEVKVFGSTNATVTYRTIRMPLYTTDQAFDVSVSGKKVGGLGIGRVSSTEVSVENAEALPETQSWNFTLDEAKLFATGSYTTETALEELPADYMILANEEKTIVLDVTRNASEGENGTMANDNAWASREYAAGETFDIYVMADGTVYTTGIEVTL